MDIVQNPLQRWSEKQNLLFAAKFELFKRSNKLGLLTPKEFVAVCEIVSKTANLPMRKFGVTSMIHLLNQFNVVVNLVKHCRWEREKLWSTVKIEPNDMKVLSRGIPGLSNNDANVC